MNSGFKKLASIETVKKREISDHSMSMEEKEFLELGEC